LNQRRRFATLALVSALELTSRQRRRLRALAHPLDPVVIVGQDGLSEGLLQEVDRALLAHELIKVRMRKRPEEKDAMATELADATGAALCGLVGHVAILYRPHPEKPTLEID
jgi:RNA-binding protein